MHPMLLEVSKYARHGIFAWKVPSGAVRLVLKSSWLMAYFDQGPNNVVIAYVLSLAAIAPDLLIHSRLLQALWNLLRAVDPIEMRRLARERLTEAELEEQFASKEADLGWRLTKWFLIEFVIFAASTTLTLFSLVRVAGALICPDHMFGITTGCVAA